MRGEPSRGLLDTSQAIFAALPAWPAALSAISSWALRQPKIAPRGSLAPAQRHGDTTPSAKKQPRATNMSAPRTARTNTGRTNTARSEGSATGRRKALNRASAGRRSRRAHLPNGAPSGAPNSRARHLLEVYCWTPRSIIYHQPGRKRSTPNSYERATRRTVPTTWTRTARSRFRTINSRRP